jgi:sigma-E factor negative regulatory protein RseC
MIEEHGRVVSSGDGRALIETRRRTGCTSCGERGGCGVAVIADWLGRRPTRVDAADPFGTHAGDEVVLGIEERALLQAAAIAYLVPLAGVFLFALAAAVAGMAETAIIAAGTVGLVAGIAMGRRLARRAVNHRLLQPRILRHSAGHENVR